MNRPDEPARFDAPWQADLFALTVALSEAGHFSWPDWTEAFGKTLAAHGRGRPLDGGEDYYHAWLETLEALLDRLGIASAPDRLAIRDLWHDAYLATPHGQPVRIPG
ncbi:MAG: nitrile hydratase accessory protein [Rhodobacteraceae bacterium]|nr:nitrile hydratase accessory protein [Paracoccaceae bacterium]